MHEFKVALPLHEEYGTGPNVYYVPPVLPPSEDAEGRFSSTPRVPTEFLRRLFGPGTDAALETLQREMARQRAGQGVELMDLLIARDWKSLFNIPQVQRA
ncbi:MAG: hypothetical protein U1F11_10265 [Steroidobacteraceae bacterium]